MPQAADRWRLIPLLGALLVAFLPQLFRLPLPITAWCLGLWGYMYLSERAGWPPPGRATRRVLIVAGVALVLFTHRFLTRDAFFIAMLAVMAGLKPMEVRTHRDRMVTVFLAYFLAVTSLFDFENLAMTGFMFLSVLVTTAVLIRENHPGGRLGAYLKTSAVMMAQAAPLMLILFVLFPRVLDTSWGLAAPGIGVTGFSDTLRPGDVSSLVRSDRVAFRAEFEGGIPPPDRLYWRGVVFEDFDGVAWRPARAVNRLRNPVAGEPAVEYAMSVEPYDGRWLFALDLPQTSPDAVSLMEDYTLRSRQKLSGKTRYRMTSVTRYVTADSSARRRAARQLPEKINPRARDLAQVWQSEGSAPGEIVERALSYFAGNGFVYTLSPPAGAEDDAIDAFLFAERRGFCEHYAAAFVFLMRAAGVPARLVGGFLGGERNAYGNYLIVRDAHAHSWAEVWIEGKGWVRVDPTLTVAPERILPGAAGRGPGAVASVLLDNLPDVFARAWTAVGDAWELINIQWDFEVMGYSSDEQRDLLSRLGIRARAWATPLLMLALMTAAVTFLYAGYRWRQGRNKARRKDPVLDGYRRFCARLAAVDLPRHPSQGPVDYARMVGRLRRDLKDRVEKITGLYVHLRYAGETGRSDAREFFEEVRKFKPRRARDRDCAPAARREAPLRAGSRDD